MDTGVEMERPNRYEKIKEITNMAASHVPSWFLVMIAKERQDESGDVQGGHFVNPWSRLTFQLFLLPTNVDGVWYKKSCLKRELVSV